MQTTIIFFLNDGLWVKDVFTFEIEPVYLVNMISDLTLSRTDTILAAGIL